MYFDRAQISGPARITKDGYFVADALVARANNIQEYYAYEMGLTDRKPNEVVRVFRPESEVFHKDALASLAHRPVTLDHPSAPVKSTNWKDLAVGDVGGEVMRDGEFIRVPIKIMDASAVASIKTDRREFSLGYTAEMVAEAGVHDGKPYDFVAKNFRYNHLAAVPAARGGPELRIIDERPNFHQQKEPAVANTIIVDGLPVSLADEAAVRAVIEKKDQAIAERDAKLADAQAAHDKAMGEKDAEIDDLKKKVVDQATIDALADAKAEVVAKAKAIVGDKLGDTKGKTVAEVRRMALDAAKIDCTDKSDDYVEARFDALTADAKPAPVQNIAPATATIADAAAAVSTLRFARYS